MISKGTEMDQQARISDGLTCIEIRDDLENIFDGIEMCKDDGKVSFTQKTLCLGHVQPQRL